MVFAGRQYFLGDKCQVGQNLASGLNVNILQIGLPFIYFLFFLIVTPLLIKQTLVMGFSIKMNAISEALNDPAASVISWFCFPGPLGSKREVLQCLHSRSRDSDHCCDRVH